MDLWTSRRVEGYLAITAHYINKDWELMEVRLLCAMSLTAAAAQCLLDFKKVEGSHTAEAISAAIADSLDKLDKSLKDKMSALSADGAGNAQGACFRFENAWTIWCLCHVLNLVVRHAFKVRCGRSQLLISRRHRSLRRR